MNHDRSEGFQADHAADYAPPSLKLPDFVPTHDGLEVRLESAPSDTGAACKRVLIAGDWAGVREFSHIAQTPPAELYGPLLEPIRKADFAIVNLECPLGGDNPIPKDGPNFRVDPHSAEAVRQAGFGAVTLANNHIFDQGPDGLRITLELCQQAGLKTMGAGVDLEAAMAPAFVDLGSVRLGLLSLAESEEGMAGRHQGGAAPIMDPDIVDRCRHARSQCDQLIVIPHGGKEYSPVPPPYWFDRLMLLVRAGADAVIGHHPHVPQGMTLACHHGRQVPVVFSTGNFVFPPRQPTEVSSAFMALGYMVELQLCGTRLSGLKLIPYRIDLPRGLSGLEPAEPAGFGRFMHALSEPLADERQVHAWFDALVEHYWEKEWCRRVEGLTAKLCRDDPTGLRHGRSHFHSMPHLTLIDRVIERKLRSEYGTALPTKRAEIEGWFAGRWPEPLLDR